MSGRMGMSRRVGYVHRVGPQKGGEYPTQTGIPRDTVGKWAVRILLSLTITLKWTSVT